MKLYATVTSDKGGREARKGGDHALVIYIANGNNKGVRLDVRHDTIHGTTRYLLQSQAFGRWYDKGEIIEFENVKQ